jgi:hypothetical protein
VGGRKICKYNFHIVYQLATIVEALDDQRMVLVVPSSTTLCERGFSKQNQIWTHLCASLKVKMLEALVLISYANNPLDKIDWNAVMIVWKNMVDWQICHLEKIVQYIHI